MHPVGHQQVELLLQASWRERIQSDNHADYGRDTHGMPLLWSGTYGGRASDPRVSCREKRVRRLMHLMRIEALFPHPRTTVSAPEHKKYPYLLRGLTIDHPNQVWEMDITYIPMRKGFMYLAAIIDVFSRRIMGWGLSNTMEAEWCAEIAEEAFRLHGRPEIFNTDQGSQFTSEVFTKTLIGEDADNPKLEISMDGRGRATDDIYIERFWRSIKYENIYLNAYETGVDLYEGVKNYINFYNYSRPHKSIGYQTPEYFYQKAS